MASGNLHNFRSDEAVRRRFDRKNWENTSLFGRFASVGTFLAFEAFHIVVYLPKSLVSRSEDSEPDAASSPYHTHPRQSEEESNVPKQIVFEDDARKPLAAGVEKLTRAVRSTLGPRGRNAVLDKGWGSPKVTKDGVTVAEDIELEDPFENLGAQLVKEAASKTNDVAGDGTTTATILAEGIFREGRKMLAAGADAMALSRGIAKAVDAVSKNIAKLAEPVDIKNKKSLQQIATIAGNNDPSIGSVLAEAFGKVGKDGVITIEEGRSNETTVEVVEGMQFDRGYLSPHFVNNEDDQSVDLESCLVLVYEEKISSAKALIPLLEAVSKAGKPLLIVAADVDGDGRRDLYITRLGTNVLLRNLGGCRFERLADAAGAAGGQAQTEFGHQGTPKSPHF
ncbi:MAG: chaperonin GroEL [Planctomycetes bacterium]|nr:chaperonin GroEL [Planctomycetota bacterium]